MLPLLTSRNAKQTVPSIGAPRRVRAPTIQGLRPSCHARVIAAHRAECFRRMRSNGPTDWQSAWQGDRRGRRTTSPVSTLPFAGYNIVGVASDPRIEAARSDGGFIDDDRRIENRRAVVARRAGPRVRKTSANAAVKVGQRRRSGDILSTPPIELLRTAFPEDRAAPRSGRYRTGPRPARVARRWRRRNWTRRAHHRHRCRPWGRRRRRLSRRAC